jgi:hypothetical protein
MSTSRHVSNRSGIKKNYRKYPSNFVQYLDWQAHVCVCLEHGRRQCLPTRLITDGHHLDRCQIVKFDIHAAIGKYTP